MTIMRTFLLLVLMAGIAQAQTPIGPPRTDLASNEGSNLLESLAVDGLGNVTLLWQELRIYKPYARRFSAADAPLGAGFQVSRSFSTASRVAANERGDTVITWSQASQGGGDEVIVRRLRPGLPQLTVRADRGRGAALRTAGDVDVDRNGRFVAVWTEAADAGGRLHAQRFNADGTYQGPEITLNAPGAEVQVDPRVAMNPATGDFMVLWLASRLGQGDRILAQRFSFRSGALGQPFQVNRSPLGDFFPEIGCAADGSCVVAWRRPRGPNRLGEVLFQRFGPDGKRRGGETLAARTPAASHPVSLAVAPQGYFVVAWSSTGQRPAFRIFRRDGTPAGPEMEITETEFPAAPKLAFGWDGTFVVGWTNFLGTIEDKTWEINYQRFEVPPGL